MKNISARWEPQPTISPWMAGPAILEAGLVCFVAIFGLMGALSTIAGGGDDPWSTAAAFWGIANLLAVMLVVGGALQAGSARRRGTALLATGAVLMAGLWYWVWMVSVPFAAVLIAVAVVRAVSRGRSQLNRQAKGGDSMGERNDVIEIPRTGEKFVFLKRPRDSQGEVFEIEFLVREFALVAARPHIHSTAEERVEVIAGAALMRMGREEKSVGPGETVVIPAGMVHSLRGQGEEFLRFRMQMRPPMKTETMFETLIGLHRDGKSLTNPLQAVVIAREHDTYLGGPPIWLQKPLIALLAAVGRLFGYRARYEKYSGPDEDSEVLERSGDTMLREKR